jgi:hypothetical protein
MPFTDDEKRAWYEEKRRCEVKSQTTSRPTPVTDYIHRGHPFGYGKDYKSDCVFLCDLCGGD